MTNAMKSRVTMQVHQVYIKASAQAVWDAITKPEWSARYGYGGRVEYDLRPGGAYRGLASEAMKRYGAEIGRAIPEVVTDGEVIEADPPRRLVQTYRGAWDESMSAEGFTRLTWEIHEMPGGVSKLTVVHDLEGAPRMAELLGGELESEGFGGGWSEILSSLKTLLETGRPLRG
jgi:uncharacterized protein YndB with AHSA1/START domain